MKKIIYFLGALGLLTSPLLVKAPMLAKEPKEKIAIENAIEAPSIGKQWLNHLVTTAKQGVYDDYLAEIDNYYSEGMKEHKFNDMKLYSDKIIQEAKQHPEEMQQMKKRLQKNSEIDEKTNKELLMLAQKNPGLQISTLINDYVDHHNLKLQDMKASQDLERVLLEINALPEDEQDMLSQTKSIFNEYAIKKALLTAHLFVSGKISKETYYSLDQILQMEKFEKAKDLCKKYPKSNLTNLLHQRIKAFEAYFPYQYEENYLISLGKGKVQKFNNDAEENASKIMSSYMAKKQKLISF